MNLILTGILVAMIGGNFWLGVMGDRLIKEAERNVAESKALLDELRRSAK